jgi:hypothetical protein
MMLFALSYTRFHINYSKYSASGRGGRSGNRVRLDNLPSGMSWQDLKDVLREYGEVSFTEVDRR